ncbi:MAG: hypothetical protein FJX51_00465, partial [Alphaproteobacteria bacterium]|nr:hypothetical protein [Alphaproteobacteria bacterium]
MVRAPGRDRGARPRHDGPRQVAAAHRHAALLRRPHSRIGRGGAGRSGQAVSAPARPWLVGREVLRTDSHLRTGAQFVESLKDGRRVVLGARTVADVTAEPALRRGIDTLAKLFDDQFDAITREATTSIEPNSGARIATGCLVPRAKADLHRHMAMIRHSTFHTFGVFGRPPDYGPVKAIGFLAFNHLIEKDEPDARSKIEAFLEV